MHSSMISSTAVRCAPREARLNELIRQYSSAIGVFLARQGLGKSDVDDARQRVWITAARHLARIRLGSERSFLFSVARREASHVRRTWRRRSEVLGVELDDIAGAALPSDDMLGRRQLIERAWTVLREMDAQLSTVLWMSHVDEATARDVAKLLQIPVGTAKSRLRRARTDCARRAAAHAPACSGSVPR